MENESDQLLAFALDLRQEIATAAEMEGNESLRAEAFTQHMLDDLADAGDIEEDGVVCYHRDRGIEVSAYGFEDDDRTLNLVSTVYTQSVPPISVTRTEI